jgi:hypothetical protein
MSASPTRPNTYPPIIDEQTDSSPKRILKQKEEPITPTPSTPCKYHLVEDLEEGLNSDTKKKVRRVLEKNLPISILPGGGRSLINGIRPLLPRIAEEIREAKAAPTPEESPVRNVGSFKVRPHVTDQELKKKRAFTVTSPQGDSVKFGQHVQTDKNGNTHNSLYPIEGEIQGNPVIRTTGEKALKAWQEFTASPSKRRKLSERLLK